MRKHKPRQDQGRWPGQWKVICDVCGFEFYSGEVQKRWDGLITCEKDWETKHPQLYLRLRTRASIPSFVRPEPADQFRGVGYGNIAIAGVAIAGISKAG